MTGRGLVTLGETMGLVVQETPGAPGNGERMSFGVGGAESNVAIAACRLGATATWIGRVGDDPAGDLILRELRAEGVTACARRDPAPTGMMVRWRRSAGRSRVVYHRAASAGSHLAPGDVPEDLVAGADLLHVTGITPALGESPAAAVDAAVDIARRALVPVSVDLNYRSALWSPAAARPVLRRLAAAADVVFAGVDEARLLVGGDPGPGMAVAGGERAALSHLLDRMADHTAGDVVLKLGADGCLARVGGTDVALAAPAVAVVDTVGAGDAFVGAYLAESMVGAPVGTRLATAVAAGAFVAASAGDWEGAPTRADLARAAGDPVHR